VSQYQDILCRQLVDYVQKLLSCDEVFKKEALDFLKENKGLMEKTFSAQEIKDLDEDTEDGNLLYAIEKYLEYLDIELPKPDETSVDTQLEAYTKYEEALDKAITSWISPDIITSDVSGEISSYADTIKNIVRAHYLRQWMSDNNFLTELGDMVTKNEDGKANMDVFDINKAHIEGLVKMSVRFIDSMKSVKAAADKDIQNLGTEPAQSSGDSSQSGDGGGSQDTGAQDDFSLDGGSDTSAQDGTTQDGGAQDGEEAQPAQEPPAQ
jgi:hypothetical protein